MNLKTHSATYIRCEGQGPATFVCDAGMGNWSLFFQPLFNELKKTARVCLVDRKGYTDFRRPKTPRDAKTIATEMNEILGQYGTRESIILVGHSLGGLNVRMYQHLYPEQVIGMVLLDAAHPQLWERIPEVKMNIEEQIKQVDKLTWLAKSGLLKMAKKRIPTFGLPAELHRDYYSITTKASYYQTYKMEMQAFGESLEQCKRLGNLGELPLLVISSPQGLNQPIHSDSETSGAEKNVWIELQKELTELSLNSRYVESSGDHFLHLSDIHKVLEELTLFYSLYNK
jgi:pimeloyl-ACP methyl ester carboxylesterase